MSAENQALWLPSPGGRFSVGEAPMPVPEPNQVVVRVRAVALNPVDAIPGLARRIVMPKMSYPAVMGSDVAGEVVSAGSSVTRFRVGDRLFGQAVGQDRTRNQPTEGAFQLYAALPEHMCSPIPDDLAFEQTAVLPLALSTASAGLFEKDQLALPFPGGSGEPRGEVVLVWGGSTSVGCNAIQLARNAGYDVIATASPKNFGMLESLGAAACFDRRDAGAVAAIVTHLRGRYLAGTLAIGNGSLGKTITIAARADGAKRVSSAFPSTVTALPALFAGRRGVRLSGIWGGTPIVSEVGPAIYAGFLPAALRDGRFTAAPEADVVGHGLDAIPDALEKLRAGVSARKLVVTL